MSTFFVTGATGFVGSNLCSLLLEEGHTVRALHRASSSLAVLEGMALERVEGDLLAPASLEAGMTGCDGVFHVAGYVSYNRKEAGRMEEIHIQGTRNVFETARKLGVPRVVHTSSVAAVGYPAAGEPPMDEQAEYNWPASLDYMRTKREAELELLRQLEQGGVEGVMVNPPTILGPRDVNLIFGQVFQAVKRFGWLPFYPPGGSSFTAVEDVAMCHLLAWHKGRSGSRYICGGEDLTYKELLTEIASLLGRRAPRWPIPRAAISLAALGVATVEALGIGLEITAPFVRRMAGNMYYDSSLARTELGFSPTPVRDALGRAVTWYRAHGAL